MPATLPQAARASGELRYAPFRHPETTLLYRVVQEQLDGFLARAERMGPLPRFVKRELEGFLDCGVPGRGFIRVRCPTCRLDGLVAFSCKGRGFCPSCGGRRMADTAAHLVDRVLPEAPVRQWVLTYPYGLRFLLANDRRLCTRVLSVFQRALLGWYRKRGQEWLGLKDGQSGTVTVIQRFGSSLGINPHLHVLALDGVYTARTEVGGPPVRFHALPPPETEEVEALLRAVVRWTLRALVRAGRLRKCEDGYEVVAREELRGQEPGSVLEACQSASVAGRVALGPRAGRKVIRVGDRVEVAEGAGGRERELDPLCAEQAGFNLHGEVWIDSYDRKRLERLCRYILRPAVASERLSEREDGRIEYRLGRPWRDGTAGFVFEPGELVERLAALVPAARGHLVRYHGVLAPSARWRRHVVRDRRGMEPAPMKAQSSASEAPRTARLAVEEELEVRERRLTWAQLMARVFAVDVLRCERCGGRRRLIAVLTDPEAIARFLDSLGLPARAPPRRRAVNEEDEGRGTGEPEPSDR